MLLFSFLCGLDCWLVSENKRRERENVCVCVCVCFDPRSIRRIVSSLAKCGERKSFCACDAAPSSPVERVVKVILFVSNEECMFDPRPISSVAM